MMHATELFLIVRIKGDTYFCKDTGFPGFSRTSPVLTELVEKLTDEGTIGEKDYPLTAHVFNVKDFEQSQYTLGLKPRPVVVEGVK